MNIQFNKTVTNLAKLKRFEYLVTDVDFEAVVTVTAYENGQPYVSNIACTTGAQKLNHFKFWNELQIKVTNEHHIREVNEYIMNTVDLDDWCNDGSDPEIKNKKKN